MHDVLYREAAEFYEGLYRRNALTPQGIAKECSAIEEILLRNARPVDSIMDAGCGTGLHSVELAARGHCVLGFDYAQAMVDIACRKAEGLALENLSLRQADMREFCAPSQCDAVICMTNAFLCNHSDGQAAAALECFNKSLRPGGACLIEFTDYLKMRELEVFSDTYFDKSSGSKGSVVEISQNKFDEARQVLVENNTYFVKAQSGDWKMHESENKLGLLTPARLGKLLNAAGFEQREFLDAETLKPATPQTFEYYACAVKP